MCLWLRRTIWRIQEMRTSSTLVSPGLCFKLRLISLMYLRRGPSSTHLQRHLRGPMAGSDPETSRQGSFGLQRGYFEPVAADQAVYSAWVDESYADQLYSGGGVVQQGWQIVPCADSEVKLTKKATEESFVLPYVGSITHRATYSAYLYLNLALLIRL